MADPTFPSSSISMPFLLNAGSYNIAEEQQWPAQLGGNAPHAGRIGEPGPESGNVPRRRLTSPVPYNVPPESQAFRSVRRAQTTCAHSTGPNAQGFPESFLTDTPRRQGTYNTTALGTFEDTKSWDQKVILSLDGGGIRGYSTLLIIRELMKAVGNQERKDGPRNKDEYPGEADTSLYPVDAPVKAASAVQQQQDAREAGCQPDGSTSPWLPCHYFDYIAGTSTGGLISIMLGRLRMNIDDCITEYENIGSELFGKPRWFHIRSPLFFPREKYNHKVLENIIQTIVNERVPKIADFPGGKTFASDENRCRIVLVSYKENNLGITQDPYLFRSYKNLRFGNTLQERARARNPGPAHDIPIWEVARATSAAPTYFKEALIEGCQYIDGGFGTNNPCEEIIKEVRRMNNHNDHCVKCVISIGTGLKETEHASKYKNMKMGLSDSLAKFIKYARFSTELVTQTEKTQSNVEELQGVLKNRFSYNRFNVDKGLENLKLDEWKTRGPLRVHLGEFNRNIRHLKRKVRRSSQDGIQISEKTGNVENEGLCDSNDTVGRLGVGGSNSEPFGSSTNSGIPEWLQPYNTLQNIRNHTEIYLQKREVKEQIEDCARMLVQIRRRRILSDQQRWRRACYGTWYQCRIDECPIGETEFHDRRAMNEHLKKDHAVLFSSDQEQSRRLIEEKIDEFEVVME